MIITKTSKIVTSWLSDAVFQMQVTNCYMGTDKTFALRLVIFPVYKRTKIVCIRFVCVRLIVLMISEWWLVLFIWSRSFFIVNSWRHLRWYEIFGRVYFISIESLRYLYDRGMFSHLSGPEQ